MYMSVLPQICVIGKMEKGIVAVTCRKECRVWNVGSVNCTVVSLLATALKGQKL